MELFTEGSDLSIALAYRNAPDDRDTAESNRKIVMEVLDRLVAGEGNAFWEMFSPDVVFHEAACLPYGGAHRGIEATQKAFDVLCNTFSDNRVVFEQVLAAGDMVIAYQTISFRVAKTGNTGTIPVAELFRFRDSKVVEWRACYFDSNLVAAAIDPDAYSSPALKG
jgi:hypothetical protein